MQHVGWLHTERNACKYNIKNIIETQFTDTFVTRHQSPVQWTVINVARKSCSCLICHFQAKMESRLFSSRSVMICTIKKISSKASGVHLHGNSSVAICCELCWNQSTLWRKRYCNRGSTLKFNVNQWCRKQSRLICHSVTCAPDKASQACVYLK